MEAMIERCAGQDVHQETVVVCVLVGPLERKPKRSIKSFSTTTKGLSKLNADREEHKNSRIEIENVSLHFN